MNNLWSIVTDNQTAGLNIGNSQLNYTGLSGFQQPVFPHINIAQILAFKKSEILAQGIQLSVNTIPEVDANGAETWSKDDIEKLNLFFIDLQKHNNFNEIITTYFVLTSLNGEAKIVMDRYKRKKDDKIIQTFVVNNNPSLYDDKLISDTKGLKDPLVSIFTRNRVSNRFSFVPQIWETRTPYSRMYSISGGNYTVKGISQPMTSGLLNVIDLKDPLYSMENNLKVLKFQEDEAYPFGTQGYSTVVYGYNKPFSLTYQIPIQLSDFWSINGIWPIIPAAFERLFGEMTYNITQRMGRFSAINMQEISDNYEDQKLFQPVPDSLSQNSILQNPNPLTKRAFIVTDGEGSEITVSNSTLLLAEEVRGVIDTINLISKLSIGFEVFKTDSGAERTATEISLAGTGERESINLQLGQAEDVFSKAIHHMIVYEFGELFANRANGNWSFKIRNSRVGLTQSEQDGILSQQNAGMITRRDALAMLNPKFKEYEILAKEKELDQENINNEVIEQNQSLEEKAIQGQEAGTEEAGTE